MKIRNRRRLARPLALIAAAAMIMVAPVPAGEAVTPPAAAPQAAGETGFIRFQETPEGGKLETSVTRYRNAAGITVDLIGAVHLADGAYYRGLNEAFKGYEVVLYELVGDPADAPRPDAAANHANAAAPADPAAGLLRGAQLMLTNLLQLDHQITAIDYTAPNFVHADVNWEKFREMQKEKGESFTGLLRKSLQAQQQLEKDLKKEGKALPADDGLGSLFALAAAIQGSDTSGLKLLLARQFEHAEQMMGHLEGGEGTVIISERNKVALAKLDEQIRAGRRNFAIFYGAGHFPDMAKRLEAMGYSRGATTWRTAWNILKPVK